MAMLMLQTSGLQLTCDVGHHHPLRRHDTSVRTGIRNPCQTSAASKAWNYQRIVGCCHQAACLKPLELLTRGLYTQMPQMELTGDSKVVCGLHICSKVLAVGAGMAH